MIESLQIEFLICKTKRGVESYIFLYEFGFEFLVFRLPYFQAVLHEVQRIVALVPQSLPHGIDIDTEINGYTIPKVYKWPENRVQ